MELDVRADTAGNQIRNQNFPPSSIDLGGRGSSELLPIAAAFASEERPTSNNEFAPILTASSGTRLVGNFE